jgi:hypothetical protein
MAQEENGLIFPGLLWSRRWRSFLAGTVGQKSYLERQILVDAFKTKDNCHNDKVWSDLYFQGAFKSNHP